MNLFDLKGKVAVVTGGNGGIGLGMAHGIASLGAAIVIAGRNEEQGRGRAGGTARHGRRGGLHRGRRNAKADCTALIAQARSNASAASTSWSTTPAPRCARCRRI